MIKKLLFILCLTFTVFLYAQDKPVVEITKEYSNLPFTDFMLKLEKEKGIIILTKPEWIQNINTLTILQNTDLDSFLEKTFKNTSFHYVKYKDYYVILPGRNIVADNSTEQDLSTIVFGNPLDEGKFDKATITGQVFDGKLKEPIPGAQIICEELSKATTTNTDGFFSIELPTGKHKIKFSFIGLKNQERNLVIYGDGEMEVELYEKTIALGQVNVLADRPEDNYQSTSMGMVKLTTKTIKKLSLLMGEADLIKSMVLLPGVQSIGENASGYNVRGGNMDQNLILINNAPVFNTSHLFGLFSILNPIIVRDVTLYKSSIPARYGSRASSVLDIGLRKGDEEKFKVNGAVGMVNSSLSVEGPITSKASFIIGGRSTYSDWMMKTLNNYQLKQSAANFYDINAKFDLTLNSKNWISIFGYLSNDYFNYFENARYEYGNKIASLKWNHIMNKNNSGVLSINKSMYDANIVDFTQKNMEYNLHTAIDQNQLSYHFSSSSIARHKLNAGAGFIYYQMEPGQSTPYNNNSYFTPSSLIRETSMETDAYLEDEFELTPHIGLLAGIRYSAFATLGYDVIHNYQTDAPINEFTYIDSKTVNKGEISSFHNAVEPRLAVKYELGKSSSLKAGYNRNAQYIRQISNTSSITPADYWKSSDQFIKPLISDQYAIGYFKNLKNNLFETSLEVYYKSSKNEVDYKNGAKLLLNEFLEQELIIGVGKAYGAEFTIKKNSGLLTGWLAYTYSRSFKKMDGNFKEEKINNGEWFPSNYDKPHDLSLVVNYKISRRFTFSSNFVYSTGRAVTYPEERFMYGGLEAVVYSDRNKYRLPDYNRLDVALTYEGTLKKKKKWRDSWTLSVYNLYGRNNTFSVFYEKQKPTAYNDYRSYALYRFSAIGIPVPSFTYNFWF